MATVPWAPSTGVSRAWHSLWLMTLLPNTSEPLPNQKHAVSLVLLPSPAALGIKVSCSLPSSSGVSTPPTPTAQTSWLGPPSPLTRVPTSLLPALPPSCPICIGTRMDFKGMVDRVSLTQRCTAPCVQRSLLPELPTRPPSQDYAPLSISSKPPRVPCCPGSPALGPALTSWT